MISDDTIDFNLVGNSIIATCQSINGKMGTVVLIHSMNYSLTIHLCTVSIISHGHFYSSKVIHFSVSAYMVTISIYSSYGKD